MISAATMRAFDEVARRQADLRDAFTPGAVPLHDDVRLQEGRDFTLDPLSVAAPGGAYFVGTDERGRQTYSRDGAFSIKNQTLVDRHGRPVLGYRAGGGLGPIRFDAIDVALGRTSNAWIGADGSVGYDRALIDPRTGAQETIHVNAGRLALARFAAATKLVPLDSTRLLAPAGALPHTGVPADGNFAVVEPHAQERSSIDIDTGIAKLQEAYLALDALRAAHSAQAAWKRRPWIC